MLRKSQAFLNFLNIASDLALITISYPLAMYTHLELLGGHSIDELPQLFNVLAGDMSLIGPRPEIPFHVRHFKEEVPLYLVRQQVRPGMIGWAQVNSLRGNTSIEERVKYDIWYIENWSLELDIRILLKTAFGGMVNNEQLTEKKDKEDE